MIQSQCSSEGGVITIAVNEILKKVYTIQNTCDWNCTSMFTMLIK